MNKFVTLHEHVSEMIISVSVAVSNNISKYNQKILPVLQGFQDHG